MDCCVYLDAWCDFCLGLWGADYAGGLVPLAVLGSEQMIKPSRGLHWNLKQACKNSLVKLNELRPNSKEIAKRMLASGELYQDNNGFLKVNEI
jgi:hypothetical protein